MKRRVLTVACLLGAVTSGCTPGRAYRLARQAEQRGEPHVAYEQYSKAASEHRSSGAVANGLARVRPGASAYWESQALLAMDRGDQNEAWRLLMKALEIEPASRSTAQLIRQIETQHGAAIAAARAEWMRSGQLAVAMATPAPAPSMPGESDDEKPVGPTSPPKGLEDKQSSEVPKEVRSRHLPPQPPPDSMVAREPPPNVASPTAPPPPLTLNEKPSRPPLRGGDDQFLAVQSLSLKDHAYPRTAVVVDGIEVRLRDTDDDLEVDLDLYAGRTRIKKIREIKIGRSQAFSGVSGRLYRLTVLGIHHKSRTVRIGIRPA